MQKSETIESQPSVIKNDLSDDVEQDAAPVAEAPQLVNAEAPSDEVIKEAVFKKVNTLYRLSKRPTKC